ncbi:hypothetical protein [Halosimplex pelagicum]|jgi:hypothetical protein|uniref:Uncharacterized protein n=1 Tax=Halosimplex pelagicum TaxID=869886 RepID=A0A7D5PBC1_9EURY|nr:hypothetical protein [Halosimplex pelagicum]QLH82162.1 hypothetical protein HZS54_11340 [Halosimplex pelagicum]
MSDSSTTDTAEDEPDDESDNSNTDPVEEVRTEDGEIPFDELPREEKVGAIFENSGEAFRHLKREWEEERVQVYFLFYSFAMVGGMLFLLYQGWTKLLIGAFAFYIITILPPLYIYEEETYFQSDKVPTTKDE